MCMFGSVPMKTTFARLMNQSRQPKLISTRGVPLRWPSIYTSFEYLYTCILITFLLFHSACRESLASQQLIRAILKKILKIASAI